MTDLCTAPRCTRFAVAKQLCHAHYEQWRRTGQTRPLRGEKLYPIPLGTLRVSEQAGVALLRTAVEGKRKIRDVVASALDEWARWHVAVGDEIRQAVTNPKHLQALDRALTRVEKTDQGSRK